MADELKKHLIPERLISDLKQIILQARQSAYAAVNACMISTYWKIGQRIVEEEQQGKTRAEYGKGQLQELAKILTMECGQGFDARRLRERSEFTAKSISFGDGNDTLQLDGNYAYLDSSEGDGKTLFGAGNDKMILSDGSVLENYYGTLTLDFGSGTDTMTFNGDVEVYADQLVITGLENITGTGSLVLNNGCTLDDETKAKFEKAGICVTLA